MSSIYDVGASIPLSFRYLLGGVPQTGQTVTVVVVNSQTGASVLASQTCTEVVSGQYVYNWTNPPIVLSNLRATYTILSKQIDEYIQIMDDELISKVN